MDLLRLPKIKLFIYPSYPCLYVLTLLHQPTENGPSTLLKTSPHIPKEGRPLYWTRGLNRKEQSYEESYEGFPIKQSSKGQGYPPSHEREENANNGRVHNH